MSERFGADYDFREPGAPAGCELLEPAADELFLDLDTEDQVRRFVRYLPKVDGMYGVRSVRVWASRHGRTPVKAARDSFSLAAG